MPEPKRCDDQLTGLWLHAHPALMAFLCSAVRDRTLADDIAQEVALAVTRQFALFDRSRPFIGWVLGIAQNKVIDHFRSSGTARRVIASPDLLKQIAITTIEIGDELARRRDALSACMGSMAGRNWQALTLRYHEDLPGHAIAKRMDISVEHVWTMLSRARTALKHCIEKRLHGDPV